MSYNGRNKAAITVAILLAVLLLGAALARIPFLGTQCDDAMITFRYARNLARGEGFVYNPGERILGTSTPLFTFLLALTALIGVPITAAADWINVACGLAACLLGYAVLSRSAGRAAGLAGAMVLAFAPEFLMNAGLGMETSLYTMLVLACIFFYASGRYRLCWITCGLLALARPEGLLLPLIFMGDALIRGRDGLPRLCGIIWCAVIVAAWCAFGGAYFGSPFPVSVMAKVTMYAREPTPYAERLSYFFAFDRPPLGLWALPFFIIGAAFALRHRGDLLLLLLWLVGYSAPVFLVQSHIFVWYYTPAAAVYLLFASLGAALAVQWVWARLARGAKGRWATGAALAAVGALCSYGFACAASKRHEAARVMYHKYSAPHVAAGEWLRERAPQEALVCVGDIGYVGYISDRRILDYVGLISPEAIRFNERGDPAGLLRLRLPDYVAGGDYGLARRVIKKDPWFRENYELMETIRLRDAIKWYIFRRRGTQARFHSSAQGNSLCDEIPRGSPVSPALGPAPRRDTLRRRA